MLSRLRIFVSLAQSEINHIAYSTLISIAHQEIVGLHVSMQEVVGMHVLKTRNHLVRQHADSFQGELATTVLE